MAIVLVNVLPLSLHDYRTSITTYDISHVKTVANVAYYYIVCTSRNIIKREYICRLNVANLSQEEIFRREQYG